MLTKPCRVNAFRYNTEQLPPWRRRRERPRTRAHARNRNQVMQCIILYPVHGGQPEKTEASEGESVEMATSLIGNIRNDHHLSMLSCLRSGPEEAWERAVAVLPLW